MNRNSTLLLAMTLALAVAPSLAQSVKPKPLVKPAARPTPKPPTKPAGPIVLGTQQLPGDFGQPGTTYTIGRIEPLNVTLKSAAYTIEPFVAGGNAWVPKADEKLLLLRFTVHNPNPKEFFLSASSLKLTGVDKTDTNRVALPAMVREGLMEPLNLALKPAQKLDVVLAILVPAAGVVPKLIVEREPGAPVIRYDLRGKVVSLPASMADESDPSGASVKKSVPAQPGTFYPLGVFDTRLDSVGAVEGKLLGRDPGAGKYWFTSIFTIKNRTATNQRYVWSDFVPELRDTDGEKPRWTQAILKATRDEQAWGELMPGEEARIRLFFALPKNVAGKTLTLGEGKAVHPSVARPFAFDLTNAPRAN